MKFSDRLADRIQSKKVKKKIFTEEEMDVINDYHEQEDYN